MCPICCGKNLEKETKLYIYGCENLKTIPYIPKLTTLQCAECPNLESIALIPSLISLYCNECPKLKLLETYPILKNLYCYGCPKLTEIPEMKMLRILDCRNCRSLTRIPDLENLRKLDCDNCRLLTSFPLFIKQESDEETKEESKDESKYTLWHSPYSSDPYFFPKMIHFSSLSCRGCPWIATNLDCNKNTKKVIFLQRWFRKILTFKKFLRIIPTLVSIFYSPGCRGSRIAHESFMRVCIAEKEFEKTKNEILK